LNTRAAFFLLSLHPWSPFLSVAEAGVDFHPPFFFLGAILSDSRPFFSFWTAHPFFEEILWNCFFHERELPELFLRTVLSSLKISFAFNEERLFQGKRRALFIPPSTPSSPPNPHSPPSFSPLHHMKHREDAVAVDFGVSLQKMLFFLISFRASILRETLELKYDTPSSTTLLPHFRSFSGDGDLDGVKHISLFLFFCTCGSATVPPPL